MRIFLHVNEIFCAHLSMRCNVVNRLRLLENIIRSSTVLSISVNTADYYLLFYLSVPVRYFHLYILHFQSILQIIDTQAKETITNFRSDVNNTLEKIPVVRVIKRIIEKTTPIQVTCFCVFYSLHYFPGLV